MKRIEHTRASAAVHRAPSDRRAGETARYPSIFGCLLAATALLCSVQVGAAEVSAQTNLEQWQLRRLNAPTERELAHERKGRVYIYDGLSDREVDHALNAHFERIEYMMFVGTRKSGSTNAVNSNTDGNADGDVATESPGCM
jgi:hypothetical protein